MVMKALRVCLPETIEQCEHDPISCADDVIYSENEISLCIDDYHDDNMLEPERTNKFWKNLARAFPNSVASRVEAIEYMDTCMDDWFPFLESLQEKGAKYIEAFKLHSCHLTERGAHQLGNFLKTREYGKCRIKNFRLHDVLGSTAWIDGFVENRTISDLDLASMPVLYGAIQFMQKSPLIFNATLFRVTHKGELPRNDYNIDVDSFKQDESTVNLRSLKIGFHEEEDFPLSLCQGIGSMLCRAKKLKDLHLTDVKGGLSHDFLKNAIHCDKIDLFRSDFDPLSISFLVHGDINGGTGGKLKKFHLHHVEDISKVEHFLQRVDLSLLDSFRITNDKFVDVLCHHLAENKGPKCLCFEAGKYLNGAQTSRLASSLRGNDKIEQFRLDITGFRCELGPQKEFLDAISTMPNLRSWSFTCSFSNDPNRNPEAMKLWQERILYQVQTNWNIQEIHLPFILQEETQEILMQNKQWPALFRCHDELSSGIWSPALSCIESFGSMYRVIREVPSLFQQAAETAGQQEMYRLPRFTVPHHPDCPGCHKKRKRSAPDA